MDKTRLRFSSRLPNLLLLLSLNHNYIRGMNGSSYNPLEFANITANTKGIVICSSENHAGDAFDVIFQIRNFWNSSIPVVVSHCTELSEKSVSDFYKFPNVRVEDICNLLIEGFESLRHQIDRLRGYFCKPAALLLSPFNETLMIDTDTIWLKNPELLFDAPCFSESGSLFFRDRFITEDDRGHFYHDVKRFIEKEGSLSIDSSIALKMSRENGISFFWQHPANHMKPKLKHVQDSSAVLINRSKQHAFLQTLRRLLPAFNLGYGEKEIYWIAATIARSVFCWEPFLFGTYGDCGAVVHYDPREARLVTSPARDSAVQAQPTPFFINAEYLLECASELGGQDIEGLVSAPVLAEESTNIFNLGTKYHPYTGGVCGICGVVGCVNASQELTETVVSVQELRVRNKRKPVGRCHNRHMHHTTPRAASAGHKQHRHKRGPKEVTVVKAQGA